LSIIRIAQALSVLGELDGAALVRVVLGDWRLWREQDALASQDRGADSRRPFCGRAG
jgi:hypothetical protein